MINEPFMGMVGVQQMHQSHREHIKQQQGVPTAMVSGTRQRGISADGASSRDCSKSI